MKRKEIEKKLKNAVEQSTPNVLDNVLNSVSHADGNAEPIPFNQGHKKRTVRMRRILAAAAVLALIFAGYFGYSAYTQVDTVVDIDTNPSISLKINRWERVISAAPLNEDAKIVLYDMNLKNVELNVAMSAILGSMVKNGYVNEAKNSILISVEHSDSAKSSLLQERLMQDALSILEANRVSGSVLSQSISGDDRLQAIAKKYGINLSMASLIDLLVSQRPNMSYEQAAKLSVNDINLLLSEQPEDGGVCKKGQAGSGSYIKKGDAVNIALKNAGAPASQARKLEAELDFGDGRMIYEIEFVFNNAEYEYEIDALTGSILSSHHEQDDEGHHSEEDEHKNKNHIGKGRAASIALADAGIKKSSASNLETELDNDTGRFVYEVSFEYNSLEYEYTIDAATGKILDKDIDNID